MDTMEGAMTRQYFRTQADLNDQAMLVAHKFQKHAAFMKQAA